MIMAEFSYKWDLANIVQEKNISKFLAVFPAVAVLLWDIKELVLMLLEMLK